MNQEVNRAILKVFAKLIGQSVVKDDSDFWFIEPKYLKIDVTSYGAIRCYVSLKCITDIISKDQLEEWFAGVSKTLKQEYDVDVEIENENIAFDTTTIQWLTKSKTQKERLKDLTDAVKEAVEVLMLIDASIIDTNDTEDEEDEDDDEPYYV